MWLRVECNEEVPDEKDTEFEGKLKVNENSSRKKVT